MLVADSDIQERHLSSMSKQIKAKSTVVKEFLTTAEVAEWLNIHPTTIYKLMENKEIHAYKIGRVNRFKKADIEEYLAKNRS